MQFVHVYFHKVLCSSVVSLTVSLKNQSSYKSASFIEYVYVKEVPYVLMQESIKLRD